MFKYVKNFCLLIMLLTSVVTASGCFWLLIGAAAGAGGYAWVQGTLVKEFDVPAQDLHRATLRALKDLNLIVKEEKSDRLSAKIKAVFADGNDIGIDIDAMTEKTSKIEIRVGLLGDRQKSELIYNAIREQIH